jgi:hypothetical protein
MDGMIEFEDLPEPEMTPERQKLIDWTIDHWVTTENGLEWRKCGPDCKHEYPFYPSFTGAD